MSLTSVLGLPRLSAIASGSRMVDATIAAGQVPTTTTTPPVEVVDDDGKIFPSPAVQMTPQKTIFAVDESVTALPQPVLYQGKKVLTESTNQNTGIVPPTLLEEPKPVDQVTDIPTDPFGNTLVNGKPITWTLLLNATNGNNGVYKNAWQDPAKAWDYIPSLNYKGSRIWDASKGEPKVVYQYDGTKWIKEGTIEHALDKAGDVITAPLTATGFVFKPMFLIAAVLILACVWFAWKKGYLKS